MVCGVNTSTSTGTFVRFVSVGQPPKFILRASSAIHRPLFEYQVQALAVGDWTKQRPRSIGGFRFESTGLRVKVPRSGCDRSEAGGETSLLPPGALRCPGPASG